MASKLRGLVEALEREGVIDGVSHRLRRGLARMLKNRIRRLPDHVAIIPDGNRRWARKRRLPPWLGHVAGYLRLKRILDFLWELGVRYVTVYAMSLENCLRRPHDEKSKLYELIGVAVEDLRRDDRVRKKMIRVNVVGNLGMLPEDVRGKLIKLVEDTSTAGPKVLNVALCYSGRWEILEATKRLVELKCVKELSEEEFTKLLPLGSIPPPDLVIRAGGELRVSNFMLWHIAYSEFYFSKKLWPDFDELELVKSLLSYQRRERRFGR